VRAFWAALLLALKALFCREREHIEEDGTR